MSMSLTLVLRPGEFAVCRLAPASPIPAWADGAPDFVSITRTPEELSIVCPAARVPATVPAVAGWRLMTIVGPFDFGVTGVIAAVAGPLADAGVSLLPIATYDTDHVLVKQAQLKAASAALTAAGHTLA